MPTTATKKKASLTEAINITPPDFQTLFIKIRGETPLVMNRFSQKALEEMRATQEAGSTVRSKKNREAKDFNALFEGAKHVSEEGWE